MIQFQYEYEEVLMSIANTYKPLQDFHINLYILLYLLRFFIFSLQVKIKMCRMFTEFHVYFENVQYYFTEFNMVQKLKYTNKIGVTS